MQISTSDYTQFTSCVCINLCFVGFGGEWGEQSVSSTGD